MTGAALLSAGAAYAYWAVTDNSNPAAAVAGVLTAPTGGMPDAGVTATPNGVPISWSAPGNYSPSGYRVMRCSGPGCTPVPITSGACSGTVTSTSCTDNDSALAPGTTYTYTVIGLLGDNWASPASASFQASTTGPAKLAFSTQPPASVKAKGSGTFSVAVTLQDGNGATVANDNSDQVTLGLDGKSGSGTLSCDHSTVTASAGVAHFTGCSIDKAGTGYKLTASVSTPSALTVTSDPFDVTAGDAQKLVFTTTSVSGAQSATATLGPVTVQEQDSNGNQVKAGSDGVTVSLTADAGAEFATQPGGSSVTSVTIAPGSASADFYFGDGISGSPVITAAVDGLSSATQTETITSAGPDKLVFTSPAVSGAASNSASVGPVTVELTSAVGTPLTRGLTVSLSSSSTATKEFSASLNGSATSTVTIPAGKSSANFYYGDEAAGTPAITASAAGVSSATQTETISAAAPAVLKFSGINEYWTPKGSLPQSQPAGTVCSATKKSYNCVANPELANGTSRSLTAKVFLVDQFGNVVTASSDIAVTLSDANSQDTVTPTVTIPSGSSTSGAFTLNLAANSGESTVTASAATGSAAVQANLKS